VRHAPPVDGDSMNGKEPSGSAGMALVREIRACGPLKIFTKIPYFKQAYQNTLESAIAWTAIGKCRAEIASMEGKGREAILDFALVRWQALIGPMQVREEIAGLLAILGKRRIKRFMEIGTAKGGTLFLFCKTFGSGASGISVDLPNGKFGGGYPEYRIPLYQSFAGNGQSLHLLRANSHDPSTLEKAKGLLGKAELDFLFIDGDHTYEGVKRDFELYSPFVKKGGIIAMHDIAAHPPKLNCHVDEFWKEAKRKYKSKELIHDRKQGWGGIGVIYK
jgi:hypothetical protein